MIGLDTNILVRHIVHDDPVQSWKVTELMEHRLTPENPGFVSTVLMAETAWVLKRVYFADDEIVTAVERTLQIETLVVEREDQVFAAMMALKHGRGSFAGALVGALNAEAGCSRTLTFDRKALRISGFELL
jgi:predicted nucleic-acid-binding protein